MSKVTTNKKQKLPEDFRWLMWSYKFDKVNPDKDRERIIVNTVNYGLWNHWRWIFHYYGKERLKRIILNLPASEFHKESLKLVSLLLGIKKMKYALRSDKIREAKSF